MKDISTTTCTAWIQKQQEDENLDDVIITDEEFAEVLSSTILTYVSQRTYDMAHY